MYLLALGLNHKTAPVRIRERAAVTIEHLDEALRDISSHRAISEAAIISTCNRTELYCRQEEHDPQALVDWLCNYHHLKIDTVVPYLYRHPGEDAVRHAFRVASGLDSMVLGEPQILGQMKEAFSIAHKTGATGKVLNRLFQQTFAVAKQVRTDTDIGASAVSVAYAAVSLAKRIFADISKENVLLIGAGDTIELAGRYLHDQGVRHIIVANRTLERAQQLARDFDGEAISLAELPSRLAEADILVSSTASTLPILGKGAVEQALKQRKHKPMFLVDLAVPRDIEEQVADLNDVYLYSVDDLREVIQENIEARQAAAEEAEKIIELHSAQFMRWLRGLDAVPTILEIREHIDHISATELERARRRLRAGDDPEKVMAQLARSLVQKFAHAPSDALNKAEPDDTLIHAARRLFNLQEEK
jgi:glutamyl-tRNA reductase